MKKWKIIVPALSLAVATLLIYASLTSARSAAQQETAGQHDHDHGEEGTDRTIRITVRDDLYEVFIEYPPVVAGEPGQFITHITGLEGFSPRRSGPVTFLISRNDVSRRYTVDDPERAGIYIPRLIFPDQGSWDLALRIEDGEKGHRIEIGRIRVFGSSHDILHAAVPEDPEGISFLKEQQWSNDFNTEIVSREEAEAGKGILIEESALISEGEGEVVFVQLAGETFEKRQVELGAREDGKVKVVSGLADGECIVTRGAWAVAEAEYAPVGAHDHDHREEVAAGHDHEPGETDAAVHDHENRVDEEAEEHDHEAEGSGGEDDHGSEQVVHMTEENMKKFGIELQRAGPGIFEIPRKTQGEIVLNADRTAHVTARVSGVTVEVPGDLGEKVKGGDLLAVIESPDLADSKAAYLASLERLDLAKAVYLREEKLRDEGISSESEYLDAKKGFAEARIENRSARQKLIALGFRSADLAGLSSAPADEFALYEVRAPFEGTVIRKHLAVGEAVSADSEIFQVSSLDTVWADLRIYQSDIGLVRAGQEVVISKDHGKPIFGGEINYVDPVIDTATRTALARVVLDNSSGVFNPGTFISAEIIPEKRAAALVVSRDTIQEVDDKPCVFVWDGHGFVLRPVVLGHTSAMYAEIRSGLKAGEMIAATNSFRLKGELTKSENASCSAHGHAH